MSDYNYITKETVKKDCRDLDIRDWTNLEAAKIDKAEAEIIRQIVGGEALELPLNEFRHGLEIELEHGIQYPDANATNNHPILTGLIVLAHLKEGLDYYIRLECMELEMELSKSLRQKQSEKSLKIARDLAAQKIKLETCNAKQLT